VVTPFLIIRVCIKSGVFLQKKVFGEILGTKIWGLFPQKGFPPRGDNIFWGAPFFPPGVFPPPVSPQKFLGKIFVQPTHIKKGRNIFGRKKGFTPFTPPNFLPPKRPFGKIWGPPFWPPKRFYTRGFF